MIFYRYVILLCVCVGLFCACSKRTKKARVSSNKKIICTTEILEDVVHRIAGDSFDVEALICGNMDPHSYELVKGEIEKLEQAHLIFSHGLGLEHGSSLSYFLHKSKKVVPLGEIVWEQFPQQFIMINGFIDPHFWMDISLFEKVIDPIVEKLSQLDSNKRDELVQRGDLLKAEFRKLDKECLAWMNSIPIISRYLVTSHDAFNYFVRRYLAFNDGNWSSKVIAPQGLAPEAEISFLEIQNVCDFIINQNVNVLFTENNISSEAHRKIKEICRKKGHATRVAKAPLFGDTLDKKTNMAGSYLGMIRYNALLIVSELSSQNRPSSKVSEVITESEKRDKSREWVP